MSGKSVSNITAWIGYNIANTSDGLIVRISIMTVKCKVTPERVCEARKSISKELSRSCRA